MSCPNSSEGTLGRIERPSSLTTTCNRSGNFCSKLVAADSIFRNLRDAGVSWMVDRYRIRGRLCANEVLKQPQRGQEDGDLLVISNASTTKQLYFDLVHHFVS